MEQVKNTKVAEKKAEVKAKAQVNENAAAKDAEKTEAFKARKAEAAKAFKERQAQLKAERAEAVKALKEFFEKNKLEMPPVVKAWIEKETAVRTASNNGVSFFNKVFGDNPKVGDKITLLDYMKKTLKAKTDLDKAVKQWAEKGIVVEFKDAPVLLDATYTIVKLA